MYIYKTTNLINNKIYIGQTMRQNSDDYLGSGTIIKRAIKKYGSENFKKEIIQTCESKEELDIQEKFWINELNSIRPNGYNICDGGQGGDVRLYMSDDEFKIFCEKISNACKGLKLGVPLSDKNKVGISKGLKNYYDNGGKNWNIGLHWDDATKEKLRIKRTGLIFSDVWKDNMKLHHCDVNGEKNPMYGKSLYSVWLEKYGKDEADIREQKWKNNLTLLQVRRKHERENNINITKIIIEFINEYIEQK